MTEHQDSIVGTVLKVLGVILAWLGTLTIADVEVVVRLGGSLIVAGYAGTQWFVLWRDKIKTRRPKDAAD